MLWGVISSLYNVAFTTLFPLNATPFHILVAWSFCP